MNPTILHPIQSLHSRPIRLVRTCIPLNLALLLFVDTTSAFEPPASQPTTAPAAGDYGPTPGHSADDCLAIARDLLDRDIYPRAKIWLEAALARADKDSTTADAAKRALTRLELLGQTPPRLSIDEWLQGSMPPGRELENKVIVLFFFEIIDPAAKHAVDAMNNLFNGNKNRDVEFFGIACVLGETEYQQPADIRAYIADQGIQFRVGLDAGGVMSLNTYKGRGVPHYALIDRAGRVRRLGEFRPGDIDFAVRKLLAETRETPLPGHAQVMPQSRAGRELIDTRAPRLTNKTWINTPDNEPPQLNRRPRLIRFLMSDCPYCRATAPALDQIHRDYADRGLVVIGVYHPKPNPRDVSDSEFRTAIRRLEVTFPCTLDADWSYLNKLWLDEGKAVGAPREYTSATFLLDKKGRIRYVHPGPDFFPSDKPEHARQNEDYKAVRAAIEKVLSE